MRTLLGMMRTVLGISVAAFIVATAWSNLPVHAQHQYGSTVSFDPLAKLFRN
jgi:hypothetical protein